MKVDSGLATLDLAGAARQAREVEDLGYDGFTAAETAHEPLFPLLLAAQTTERVELLTEIVVAFARSPMTLAMQAHDVQSFSKGRLVLGLGSQIRPHITKRFSMPWSSPAARMREYILALRAIWRCWYDGEPLDFRGEFYSHTLMTPMFTPRDVEHGAPKVFLAAVGPLMTRVAGEVADGILCHPFSTRRYLETVTIPAIEEGLASSGRSRDDFQVVFPGFVVTGPDEESFVASKAAVARQLAFYGSTPAYRPVLETHGWGDLQGELNFLSKRGEWDEMGRRVTDEMIGQFAVVAEPDAVVAGLLDRYRGVVDRTSIGFPWADIETQKSMLARLRSA